MNAFHVAQLYAVLASVSIFLKSNRCSRSRPQPILVDPVQQANVGANKRVRFEALVLGFNLPIQQRSHLWHRVESTRDSFMPFYFRFQIVSDPTGVSKYRVDGDSSRRVDSVRESFICTSLACPSRTM